MSGKFRGNTLAVILVTVMLSISVSPMIFNNQMGTQPQSGNYPSTIFGSLQEYAQEHGTTVEQLTANWTANDWIRWYKYEGNPSWGSTNITDQFLATDWVKLPNSGNLTWGANYDYEYKYNSTSDQLEMWHNGTLVSYLASDDLWHYASDRPNLTDLHHIVDREYVDHAVTSLGARYYMIGNSSGISDYKLTQLSPPSGSEDSVTKTGLADDDYIAGWISPDTSMSKLIKGVYNWHIYAEKTGGTKTLRLYWKLIERKSDTTENVIATSVISNEILNSKNSYIITLTLSDDYTLADGSYVVGKIYADVSGSGSAPDIEIYFNGTSKSHWEIPINLEIFSDQFLKLDGSNANSDIDISPYNLTVNNISAFNLKYPASYIIWTDGTNVYAMNGSTGKIDYSGNATTVIQNTIDILNSGNIIIKGGIYHTSTYLHIEAKKNIVVEGESWGAILKPDGTFPVIVIGNDTDANKTASKIIIRNLCINGSNQNDDTSPPSSSTADFLSSGIGIGILKYADDIEIDSCLLLNTGSESISGLLTEGKILIHNNIIRNCSGYFAAIHTHGGNQYWQVIGNWIEDSKSGGIRHGNVISNNVINNCSSGLSQPAISTGNNGATIVGNYIGDCHGSGIWTHPGDKTVIANNRIIGNGEQDGIHVYKPVDNPSPAYEIQDIVVKGNIIENFDTGIRISGANRVIVSGNIIKDSVSNGIFVARSVYDTTIYTHSCMISNNIIRNTTNYDGMQLNYVYNSTVSNNMLDGIARYGIRYVYCNNIYLLENEFLAIGNLKFNDGGNNVNVVIKCNIGYTTENSGSSEITGDGTNTSFSISFPTSFGATPSIVLVTPTNSSMASATWWVSAKSSTTFTITFSTAPSNNTKLSFDWYAEV